MPAEKGNQLPTPSNSFGNLFLIIDSSSFQQKFNTNGTALMDLKHLGLIMDRSLADGVKRGNCDEMICLSLAFS